MTTKKAAAKKAAAEPKKAPARKRAEATYFVPPKPGPEGGSPKVIKQDFPAPDAEGRSPKEVVSHQEQFSGEKPSMPDKEGANPTAKIHQEEYARLQPGMDKK